MSDPVNIVLVLKKSEEKVYTIQDVLRLARNLRAHREERTIRIYCITDIVKTSLFVAGIQLIPMPNKWEGAASKMNVLDIKFEQLRPFLYMDLDTAVLAPYLSCLPSVEHSNKLVTLEDFARENKINSSMMWIPNTPLVNKIWEKWMIRPQYYIQQYKGYSSFLIKAVGEDKFFFQQYYNNLKAFKPLRAWMRILPEGTSIVHFNSLVNIDRAADKVQWVAEYIKG